MSAVAASVVITTRNRPDLADRAVASALAQTLADIEVIVVDDGSDQPYRTAQEDERLSVIRHHRPRGPCAARNTGLEAASGEWITFLDDDDTIEPEMIDLSLASAASSNLPPPISVLSGIDVVDQDGEVLERRLPPTIARGGHYFLEQIEGGVSFQTHNTLVAPVTVVREIGGWDESLLASEHDDFFLRLNSHCSLQGVPEVTYRMTAHQGPRLSKVLRARADAMRRTLEVHQSVFRLHRRRHAHYRGTMGVTYLRSGEWAPAVRATTRALVTDPLRATAYKWWLASLAGPRVLTVARQLRDGH
jgi:glycosyltransferase involved in cell wall biosynthesis